MSARQTVEQPAEQAREQFIVLPVAAVRDRLLSSTEYHVLCAVLTHDWESNDRGCTASYATLAAESQTSESTVKRALKKLEALHYILPRTPNFRGNERIGTTIKVSGKVRPGRPIVTAAAPHSAGIQQPLFEGGSTVDPPSPEATVQAPGSTVDPPPVHGPSSDASRAARGFQKKFRANEYREALLPDDAGRLRQLDAWGCTDSEDWLAIMLGIIRTREASLGREPQPARIRAVYDGAARSRQLAKAGVDHAPALLLAGIERGFLLARPKAVNLADLPPGQLEALMLKAEDAKAGRIISDQTLSDYGITRMVFNELVARIADSIVPNKIAVEVADIGAQKRFDAPLGSTVDPPPPSHTVEESTVEHVADTADMAALRERLEQTLPESVFKMYVKPSHFKLDGHHLMVHCRSAFERDQFVANAEEHIQSWGFKMSVQIADRPTPSGP